MPTPRAKDLLQVVPPAPVVWPQWHPPLFVHLDGGTVQHRQAAVHSQESSQAHEERRIHHERYEYCNGPAGQKAYVI